jgi:hypothetical protein
MSKTPEAYFRNTEQAPRTALHLAEFIITNIEHLRRKDQKKRMENAVNSFMVLLKAGEKLTPGQYSYLEGIYEATMRGMGLESVNVHSDRKRRALRFG